MRNPNELYPLTFTPIYKEKVWGGRALEKLGRRLPGDASVGIGESWEIADLATTSKSGGGGNAEHSVVADGPLKGKTIGELIQTYGEKLLGAGPPTSEDGGFPLLIKFLDAKENLSVQVHPSPEYAAAHPEAHLKSEAWYIVDAEPGAVIYKGLKPGTTPDQLRAALEANTDDAVVPLLSAVPVKTGDCHYLPSGTLHALGAGVLVAEVQTPSDTTFRVYDWGRTDRELHVEQAMACIDFPAQELSDESDAASTGECAEFTRRTLAVCRHFLMHEWTGHQQASVTHSMGGNHQVWIMLEGQANVTTRQGQAFMLDAGATVLLPSALIDFQYESLPGSRWLQIRVPERPAAR